MKIFVSYSHKQKDWVLDWLLPALDLGGHEVLIDRRRFTADDSVWQQMDASQDQAEKQILVFSKEYLASKACLHEFERACAQDRVKLTGIKLDDSPIPPAFGDRFYLDFSRDPSEWDEPWLVFARTIPIGMPQPYKWLQARLRVLRAMARHDSVNLVKNDDSYKKLLEQIQPNWQLSRNKVDLSHGGMSTHGGVVKCLLEASGLATTAKIDSNNWLQVLNEGFKGAPGGEPRFQIWTHFDSAIQMWADRKNKPKIDSLDFLATIRHLTQTPPKRLVLLLVTNQPVGALMERVFQRDSPIHFETVCL